MMRTRSNETTSPESREGDRQGWAAAMSLVTFAFSLVLIMSAALFATVGVNPKNEVYGWLPWAYAILSLVGSAVFWLVSRHLDGMAR